VRGLLCSPCNTHLGRTGDTWAAGSSYLANAWWRRQCLALGLPAGRRPEPKVGTAISNQWGIVWIRAEDWWRTPTQRGHNWSPTDWSGLYHSYGPHNLAPFDMAVIANDPSMWLMRLALVKSPVWAQVREVTGIALKPGDVYCGEHYPAEACAPRCVGGR
jgi:hypothetical protein